MILQKDNSVETFSIGNESIKGNIDNNKVGKIFQLLSNLYSNREEIILQECVANAQDSYTRLKKDGIVTIKFNKEDRTLHIIDKAEGISPYVFQNIFTKLGSSSKENEDDSAGTLGIGSMSSWTLVNCFYLNTVYNGTKYIYSCSKRDYEEPEFTLLLEEPTDEENGTDYWFYLPPSTYSYKDSEYDKFQKALTKLRYFHNVTVEGFDLKMIIPSR
jgi:HSP90 family molecular chaperone